MISPYRSSENRNGLKRPQKVSKEHAFVIESVKPITFEK